jgi:hypothetical protein
MCKIWSPNVGTSFDFADKDVWRMEACSSTEEWKSEQVSVLVGLGFYLGWVLWSSQNQLSASLWSWPLHMYYVFPNLSFSYLHQITSLIHGLLLYLFSCFATPHTHVCNTFALFWKLLNYSCLIIITITMLVN